MMTIKINNVDKEVRLNNKENLLSQKYIIYYNLHLISSNTKIVVF